MHSLKDYSLNIPEAEYHSYPAWSYSVIAKYAKEGFSAIATLHEPTTSSPSMEFGSLFDSIMTKGMKETLDNYIVCEMNVPPAEKCVLDALAITSEYKHFDDIPAREVILAAESVRYQPKWGADARYRHISEYAAYYDTVKSGKKMVSKSDWDDATQMADIFHNDEYLSNLFGTENSDDVEYIYQAQFVENYELGNSHGDVKLKIMPDLLKVNHGEKTIQPVDLKTSAMPAYSFADNFIKYRYDIQAELYTDVLERVKDKDPDYSDYTILPYLFTDVSRTDKVPVTYKYDPTEGFSYSRGDRMYEYKGWESLLNEILDYEESQAKVPSYIKTDEPNDLITILSRQ